MRAVAVATVVRFCVPRHPYRSPCRRFAKGADVGWGCGGWETHRRPLRRRRDAHSSGWWGRRSCRPGHARAQTLAILWTSIATGKTPTSTGFSTSWSPTGRMAFASARAPAARSKRSGTSSRSRACAPRGQLGTPPTPAERSTAWSSPISSIRDATSASDPWPLLARAVHHRDLAERIGALRLHPRRAPRGGAPGLHPRLPR